MVDDQIIFFDVLEFQRVFVQTNSYISASIDVLQALGMQRVLLSKLKLDIDPREMLDAIAGWNRDHNLIDKYPYPQN